jgi:hypothetical protein
MGWGRLQTAAQLVLFAVILALIWIKIALSAQGSPAGSAISGSIDILILLAMAVTVLPRLSSFSFEPPGVTAQMALRTAKAASQSATQATGGAVATKVAQQDLSGNQEGVNEPTGVDRDVASGPSRLAGPTR